MIKVLGALVILFAFSCQQADGNDSSSIYRLYSVKPDYTTMQPGDGRPVAYDTSYTYLIRSGRQWVAVESELEENFINGVSQGRNRLPKWIGFKEDCDTAIVKKSGRRGGESNTTLHAALANSWWYAGKLTGMLSGEYEVEKERRLQTMDSIVDVYKIRASDQWGTSANVAFIYTRGQRPAIIEITKPFDTIPGFTVTRILQHYSFSKAHDGQQPKAFHIDDQIAIAKLPDEWDGKEVEEMMKKIQALDKCK